MGVVSRISLLTLIILVSLVAFYFAGLKSGFVEAERQQTIERQEQREAIVAAAIERTKKELVQALLKIDGVTGVPSVQTDWTSMDEPGRETCIAVEIEAASDDASVINRSQDLARIFLRNLPKEAVTIRLLRDH